MFSGLGWIAPSASVAMRREILANLPLWVDEAPFGDLFHFLAGSARGGAWYDPTPTICYRVAQPTSFSAAHSDRTPRQRIEYLQKTLFFIDRARRHYRVPRAVLATRINDYRLQLAKDFWTEGQRVQAFRNLARIDFDFLAKGFGRRALRSLPRSKAA
jgi:hypothetical protein